VIRHDGDRSEADGLSRADIMDRIADHVDVFLRIEDPFIFSARRIA